MPVLKQVSFSVNEGEMVGIIGANGSGKTTLARHLNVLLQPSSGCVRVAGLDVRETRNYRQIRELVGMVFQNPEDQIVATTVEEDIAFGLENIALPAPEIRRRVEQTLIQFDLQEIRQRPPYLLSAGQKQRVALAGVAAMRPQVVIFDETTAMLDPAGRKTVMEMMHNLHQQGGTVIYITHFMEEAAQAERLLVLKEGELILDASPREVFSCRDTLLAARLDVPEVTRLAGRFADMPVCLTMDEFISALLPTLTPFRDMPLTNHDIELPNNGNHLVEIQAEGLEHVYLRETPLAHPALQGVELTVVEGTIHGLIGATGSGKSTLLQHLNALLLPQKGTVRVGAYDLNDERVDVRQVRKYAGMVFQNPDAQFFAQYVGDEIAFGPKMLNLSRDEVRERVHSAMEAAGLDFAGYKDRLTVTLSGGEKRKVALASTLANAPHVLLLDEPTGGLDPKSRWETLALVQKLNATGVTMVISSHHMEDLAQVAGGITILGDGRSQLDGDVQQVFSRLDIVKNLRLAAPLVTEIAEVLRLEGYHLFPGIVNEDQLVGIIQALRSGRDE